MSRTPPAQPTAPYLEAITAYGFRGSTRFHVPGHKGGEGADPGLRAALGDDALLLDIPQDIEGIDVGPSPTPYERAELLAAEAYGAERTWFLTNGATQGNHALCLALAPPGRRVVLQRNSHASLIDGLILSGGSADVGRARVRPRARDGARRRRRRRSSRRCVARPSARAAFIVSPTYYGMAADVAACAEVAHRAGAALIVDNAWGSHFGFHGRLPESPLRLGADAMIASTHKIVGSLTQSAMLLVASGRARRRGAVARAVRLVRSTSPSSLLMASLDAARRQLAVHGEALLDRTIKASSRARDAIDAVAWLRGPRRGSRRSARDRGLGPAADRDRRPPHRLHAATRSARRCARPTTSTSSSRPTRRSCSCSVSGSRSSQLERLAHDFAETVRRIARPAEAIVISRPPAALEHETVIAPRDAFLGDGETVPVDEAIGTDLV